MLRQISLRQTSLVFTLFMVSAQVMALAQGKPQTTAKFTAEPRQTVLGTVFLVRPAWDEAIRQTVQRVRKHIRSEKAKGKVICHVSIPLSARGGGHQPTNVEISRFVKRRLEAKYGASKFWALAPGVAENELPVLDGEHPGGGEYLYMWTQILAGDDGNGGDFDMVYFVGPTDLSAFLGIGRGGVLESLDTYISKRAKSDPEFRDQVANVPQARFGFLRYYGVRASVAYSKGARDEWNIFRLINRRRRIPDQVAVYFDGRAVSPAAAETGVRPGYEQRP